MLKIVGNLFFFGFAGETVFLSAGGKLVFESVTLYSA